jgi:hypothetical protein
VAIIAGSGGSPNAIESVLKFRLWGLWKNTAAKTTEETPHVIRDSVGVKVYFIIRYANNSVRRFANKPCMKISTNAPIRNIQPIAT